MYDDETLGIAVVGSGYWGKNLVRNFHSLGTLKLICDKNEQVLSQFNEQYPGVETCVALSDALACSDVTGVVIATPAETHYTLSREVLLAGKHLYVEKPMALKSEEAEDLIAIAERQGRILMVGHLLQYHPVFQHLKSIVASGDLGRINYLYSNRLNLGKIRREENILWSFAPHDISMILSLAGEEPTSVLTTGANYLHQRIADVTTTHLEFSSGIRAHIFVSWLHPFKEQKLVVVGDRKMAVFDDTKPWSDKLLVFPHQINWKNNIPIPAKASPARFDVPEQEPLRLECEHFIKCMSNSTHCRTDGREGLRVLKVLNASQRSLDLGGQRIVMRYRPPGASSVGFGELGYSAHETCIIDEDVQIGRGTKIWHFSHILSGSHIGERCTIGQNVVIGPDVTIGRGCKIQNNVSVYKGVVLEDEVFCAPSMVFTNVYNPRAHIRKMDEVRPTLVRKRATLGANCTIVCGVTIGRYAFIGAGAVVTKSVADHALVVGNPARQIGWVCQCGERLTDDLECLTCSSAYVAIQNGIAEKSNPDPKCTSGMCHGG